MVRWIHYSVDHQIMLKLLWEKFSIAVLGGDTKRNIAQCVVLTDFMERMQ